MAPARHSLFFALLPPPELAAQVAEATAGWCTRLGLSGRPMEPERLHLTLLWIAPEASPATVTAMKVVAARLVMPPATVVLDRLGRFERREGRSAPVVLLSSNPVALEGLQALKRALVARVQAAGYPLQVSAGFQPHMTLLYDRQPVALQPAGPFVWMAHDIALIHSHVGERRYDVLGRWPLRAAAT